MSPSDVGNRLGSELSLQDTYIVTSFIGLALYNVLELTYMLFMKFRRRRSLYFWSLLATTWGIAFYSIGYFSRMRHVNWEQPPLLKFK
ncbi:hypothetical protein PENSUB_12281 [Penicillium subrubescens]|uniref:DUF7703 domain-containing protein n=1 Tax=Penicillium subrubescens TaxID=1316194 RepID=A0A1Q5SYX6_9EURO|nr:hypothetical protein PENSUB_12281 [Penicillium subrubescens]